MDTFGCSVKDCRAAGTEVLERDGFVLCHVCPEHREMIEADEWEGWVSAPNTKGIFNIVREAA